MFSAEADEGSFDFLTNVGDLFDENFKLNVPCPEQKMKITGV